MEPTIAITEQIKARYDEPVSVTALVNMDSPRNVDLESDAFEVVDNEVVQAGVWLSVSMVPLWTCDLLRDVVLFHDAFLELDSDQVPVRVGSIDHYWARLMPDDLAAAQADFRRATESEVRVEYRHRIVRTDGSIIMLDGVLKSVASNSGVVVQVINEASPAATVINSDEPDTSSSAVEAVEPASPDEIDLRDVLNGIDEGAWELDPETHEATFSPTWFAILGYRNGCGEGNLEAWMDLIHPEDQSRFRLAVGRLLPKFSEVLRMRRRDGAYAWIWVRGARIETHLRTIYSGTTADVSSIYSRSSGLSEMVDRWRAFQDAAEEAILIVSPTESGRPPFDFSVEDWNAAAQLMFGLGSGHGSFVLLSDIVQDFHGSKLAGWLQAAQQERAPQIFSERVALAGVREIWTEYRVSPNGSSFAIQVRDTTNEMRERQAQSRRERMLSRIAEASPDYIYVWDPQLNRTLFENRSMLADLGYPEGLVQSRDAHPIFKSLYPEDVDSLRAHVQTLSTAPNEPLEILLRVLAPNGRKRWFKCRHIVLERDSNGVPCEVLGVAQDATSQRMYEDELRSKLEQLNRTQVELEHRQAELEELNAKLGSLAHTDGLTGLNNHRAFQDRLAEEVDRAHRYGHKLALVLADVDHFKQYNDEFGHPAGDEMLRRFADVLQECSRTSDFVVRYGGEEFGLLLPHTSAEEAASLAERIRSMLKLRLEDGNSVTASFGCAELRKGREAKEKLVSEADRALYRSKRGGRDRVTIASN